MTSNIRITLAGCGKMGSALLEGWARAFPHYEFGALDPHAIPRALSSKVTHATNAAELSNFIAASDVIILAVKPQVMEEVCKQLAPHIKNGALILSIAAGQSLARFADYFSANQPVIRAMPNTPAAIGKGMSVAIANQNVTPDQRQSAHALLQSAGLIEWVEDEALLDAVTAVSGSGPAYVFYLIEALAAAAQSAGLTPELSQTLARQTIIGSAALAESAPEIDAATLRQNVTSPGGTTAAALEILMNGDLQGIMNKAITAAKTRSEELN